MCSFTSVYARPIVSADTTVPWAATLNCIRNTLVLIFPLVLYLYAPKPHTPNKPMIPERNSQNCISFKTGDDTDSTLFLNDYIFYIPGA